MSLVSGPGKGGSSRKYVPEELALVIDMHVEYIQSLDTVRSAHNLLSACAHFTNSDKMNWNTG